MNQSKKLNTFNTLYNKFIFEWSDGKPLEEIIDILTKEKQNCKCKNQCENNFYDCETDQDCDDIQCCDNVQCSNNSQCQINNNCSEDDIKNCFYQKFPSFLIIKCQNKFPIDDNTNVPEEIITDFWEKYKKQIISSLLNCAKDVLSDIISKEFINIFGAEDEYNENIFNQSALKIVSKME